MENAVNLVLRNTGLGRFITNLLRRFRRPEKRTYVCLTCLLPDPGETRESFLNHPFADRAARRAERPIE